MSIHSVRRKAARAKDGDMIEQSISSSSLGQKKAWSCPTTLDPSSSRPHKLLGWMPTGVLPRLTGFEGNARPMRHVWFYRYGEGHMGVGIAPRFGAPEEEAAKQGLKVGESLIARC